MDKMVRYLDGSPYLEMASQTEPRRGSGGYHSDHEWYRWRTMLRQARRTYWQMRVTLIAQKGEK